MLAWRLRSKQHPCALAHNNAAGVVAGDQGLSDDIQVAAKASVSLWRQRRQQHEETSIILVARVGGRTEASFQPRV